MADKKKEKNFRYLFEERNNKTSTLKIKQRWGDWMAQLERRL